MASSGSKEREPSNRTLAFVPSGATTIRLVQPGKVASAETSITGTGGRFPGKTVMEKVQEPICPAVSIIEQVT